MPYTTIVSICSDTQVIPPVSLTIVNAIRGLYDGGPMVEEGRGAVSVRQHVGFTADMVAFNSLRWNGSKGSGARTA